MIFREDECYRLWSRMTDNLDDRIEVMTQLFGINEYEALELDKKFKDRRNETIWNNSNPYHFSKVVV